MNWHAASGSGRGAMPLHQVCRIQTSELKDAPSLDGYPFVFKVYSAFALKPSLLLAAPTAEERRAWVTAISAFAADARTAAPHILAARVLWACRYWTHFSQPADPRSFLPALFCRQSTGSFVL